MAENISTATLGLNLDSVSSQIREGNYTYALNAIASNFDGNSYTLQNEEGNVLYTTFPDGYKPVGFHNILEKNIIVCFLKGDSSEIGTVDTNTSEYTTKINASCLGFEFNRPILKAVHKITNCDVEVYWTDGTQRKFVNLEKLPYKEIEGCPSTISTEIDCNKLLVQPNFSIPKIEIAKIDIDGTIQAGTLQFAVQYSNALSEAYTSFYSISNPLSIFDKNKITQDFNYEVNASVDVLISKLDTTGYYDYFNLAVIKTINNIPTPYLVGTYEITSSEKRVTYSGQKLEIPLSVFDIQEKYPVYENAKGLTTAQDILIWYGLETEEQVNYQKVWNKVHLQWETYKLNTDYKGINNNKYKGFFRDETYALEGCFLLRKGKQTDGFHIPSRIASAHDRETIFNSDVPTQDKCLDPEPLPRYRVYNTAQSLGKYETSSLDCYYEDKTLICPDNKCYQGKYEYGEFAYSESTDTYPCSDIWGELSGKPIRHHKFPDSSITHIHDDEGNIYPLGIKIDIAALKQLIQESDLTQKQKDDIVGFKILRGNRASNKSIIARGLINNVGEYQRAGTNYYFPNYPYNDIRPDPLIEDTSYTTKNRFTFHSPDTHFFQPAIGNTLKLETVEYGESQSHFVQVKNHSKYKLLSIESFLGASIIGLATGFASGSYGIGSTNVFSGVAAWTAYQAITDIFLKITPRTNPTYQLNSIGNYNKFKPVINEGNKQRNIDLSIYTNSGVISTGDNHLLNNYQRESSVYLKTTADLPYTYELTNAPQDQSRWKLGNQPLGTQKVLPISSFYATIKSLIDNQWGQIYSYQTVDTGFQSFFDKPTDTVFGGDCFINKFSYKTKLPLFIDNRVNAPDDSDVFYNELFNVGNPTHWFSMDPQTGSGVLGTIFGVPTTGALDNRHQGFFNVSGQMYLFAYGIPTFFCESEVNVDLRQAYNGKEGDFYPRVGNGIPDDWLQETNVSIANDNTYLYNKTYSKQNTENTFTHLPPDWEDKKCKTSLPFRSIFSEEQKDFVNYRRNNWLVYRPAAKFDFPQNYGGLTSLDGIENKQVLARFENKTLLYNALLTAPTSSANLYLGQSLFSSQVPPLDFADTDLGFVGSQHTFLLKTEYGPVTVDAKRGQIFILNGTTPQDISGSISKFLTEFLEFKILKYFPINIDNHFNGVGLHGVYDPKYNRLILTKLDYTPLRTDIVYKDGNFTLDNVKIELTDIRYFCNNSFTISYCFDLKNWTSFHSYLPNYYVGNSNWFYSGNTNLWKHNSTFNLFNNFFGNVEPYVIEYPIYFKGVDEILQNVKDYSKVLKYFSFTDFIETDDTYFTKAVIWNNQQCSGTLKLTKRPKNNLSVNTKYPIYRENEKEILYTKSNSMYQFNTFWALQKTSQQPMWIKSCESLSIYKELNNSNMNYSKRAYNKAPLMSKSTNIRLILEEDTHKIISQFLVTPSQTSYK